MTKQEETIRKLFLKYHKDEAYKRVVDARVTYIESMFKAIGRDDLLFALALCTTRTFDAMTAETAATKNVDAPAHAPVREAREDEKPYFVPSNSFVC